MKKVFLKSTLLLCALIVGMGNVWGDTKPWSGSDPSSTLNLKTITSSTMGTWNGTKSWYLCNDTLIVSGYESYKSVSNQSWITHANVGSSSSTWSASTPFKGSSYYTNAYYATIQSGRYLLYKVTNLKSIKVYGRNNSTSKYLDVFIYTKDANNNYTKVEEIKYTTDANDHIWESSAKLSPSNTYFIYITGVGNSNSRVFEVAFERNLAESHTLSYEINPSGVGTVTLGETSVTEGGSTTISAAATNVDYRFKNWTKTSGTVTDANAASTSFTMGTADATVIANFELIPTRVITVTPPSGGIITVKNGEDDVVSGDAIKEGTTLTIIADAGKNYEFTSWVVTGATPTSTTDAETTFIVGEDNVSIGASFNSAITHEISWSVNGAIVKSQNVKNGSNISFAAPASGVPIGMVYTGWVSKPIEGTQSIAPSYVTEATSEADVTYYCVLAVEVDGEATATLTANWASSSTTYGDHSYTDNKGYSWSGNTQEPKENSVSRIGLRSTSSSQLTSPKFPGKVISIKMYTYNGSSSDDRVMNINSSATSNTADLGTISAPKNVKCTSEQTATLKKEFDKFVLIPNDGSIGFSQVAVTYCSVDTSHYCTSAIHAITPTPDKYYSTFYAPYNVQLPTKDKSNNDITVTAFIGVRDEDALKLYPFDGNVIPKETAVILKSSNGNAFNVTATATAASTLADNDDDVTVNNNSLLGTAASLDASTLNKAYILGYNEGSQPSGFYMKPTGNIPANKAYLVIAPAATAPSAIRIEEEENNATNIQAIDSNNDVVKYIQNGQLFIKRDGVVYDALGRVIK